MARYEWVTSVETAERIRKVAPPSVSVITMATEGEPFHYDDHSGYVPDGHVYLAIDGKQEDVELLWRKYHADD